MMRFWILVPICAMAATAQPQPGPMSLTDLQQFMAMVRQQVDGGQPWKKAEGAHVVLNYVASDTANTPGRVSALIAMYDKCVEDDCQALKLSLPEPKVPVYLFPTLPDLQAAIRTPLPGPVSMRGWSALVDGGQGMTDQARGTAAHELGHALIYDQVGLYGCPVFAEGIATYLEAKQGDEAWLKNPRPIGSSPLTLLTLTAKTPEDFKDGAEFFGYLMNLDKQDPTRVKAVLAAISKERLADLRQPGKKSWPDRVDDAFSQVYGLKLAQLETQWRKSAGG